MDKLRDTTMKTFGDNTCTICMEMLQAEDEVVQLRCHKSHVFHYTCLETYLNRSIKKECPLCRAVIM